jgi:hypothetical protein
MSRFSGGPIIHPTNDVLTALLGAAVVAQIIALVVMFVRAKTLGMI